MLSSRVRLKIYLIALAAGTFSIALAIGTLVLRQRSIRITLKNYDALRPGMPESEVFAILGKPWGSSLMHFCPPDLVLTEEAVTDLSSINRPGSMEEYYATTYWYGEDMVVAVVFDDNRRVIAKGQQRIPPWHQESFLERLWHHARYNFGW